MIDEKKIEEAAQAICFDDKMSYDSYCKIEGFRKGAEWAINEFLKDLFYPASEVPRNDNGKVLAFSRKVGFRKLYDMNDELDKTTCDTYQEMWEEQVHMFKLSDWIFVDELFDLIIRR
jgi:hypothetical protein|nr:MAG TPA: hypothetical protein [Caudoviricetes sp.]